MTKEQAIIRLKLLGKYCDTEECFHADCYKCYRAIDKAIESLQQEPKRGKWIPLVMNGEYKCSVCGRASKSDNAAWVNIPTAYWNYCPNCGARMEEIDTE